MKAGKINDWAAYPFFNKLKIDFNSNISSYNIYSISQVKTA